MIIFIKFADGNPLFQLKTKENMSGGILSVLVAILGGFISASGLIVRKRPNSKELFDKLIPIEGVIGVFILFWGLVNLFQTFGNLDQLHLMPLFWFRLFFIGLIEIIVGFLLAYNLLAQYLFSKNKHMTSKGESLRNKILRYEIPAGIILMALGVLQLIYMIQH